MDETALLKDLQELTNGPAALLDPDLSSRIRINLRTALRVPDTASLDELRARLTTLVSVLEDVEGKFRPEHRELMRLAVRGVLGLDEEIKGDSATKRRACVTQLTGQSDSSVRRWEKTALSLLAKHLAAGVHESAAASAQRLDASDSDTSVMDVVAKVHDESETGNLSDSSDEGVTRERNTRKSSSGEIRNVSVRGKSKERLVWMFVGALITVTTQFVISAFGHSESKRPVDITIPDAGGTYSNYPHDGTRRTNGDGSSVWDFNIGVRKGVPGGNYGMDMNFLSSAPISRIRASLAYKPDPAACKLDLLWKIRSASSGVIEEQGRLSANNPRVEIDKTLTPATSKFQILASFDWKKKGEPSDVSVSSDPPCDKASLVLGFPSMYPASS